MLFTLRCVLDLLPRMNSSYSSVTWCHLLRPPSTCSKENSETRIRIRWVLLKILLDGWQLFATVIQPAKQGWDIDPTGA